MDQRNAGRSRTIDGSDGWHVYAADHLALHRFHVMGGWQT
jgi:hypothetical protein